MGVIKRAFRSMSPPGATFWVSVHVVWGLRAHLASLLCECNLTSHASTSTKRCSSNSLVSSLCTLGSHSSDGLVPVFSHLTSSISFAILWATWISFSFTCSCTSSSRFLLISEILQQAVLACAGQRCFAVWVASFLYCENADFWCLLTWPWRCPASASPGFFPNPVGHAAQLVPLHLPGPGPAWCA
jgi:hypothetical protein